MKTIFLSISLILSCSVFSQLVTNLDDTKFDVDFENILIKKLDTDSNSTSFIIWIKKGVKSHKHLAHSELIYVIEGEGIMIVDGSRFPIGPGDYFRIPKNTNHTLDVTSKKFIKVLSIQAPEFFGKDSILDEQGENSFHKDRNAEVEVK